MPKYKPDEFINDALIKKVNAEIEKQFEEYEQQEETVPKAESRVGIFGWIMLAILLIIVGMKLVLVLIFYSQYI